MGIRHGIGCGQQQGIGGMDVPAGDTVRLVPEQRCDRRLVVAETLLLIHNAVRTPELHCGCFGSHPSTLTTPTLHSETVRVGGKVAVKSSPLDRWLSYAGTRQMATISMS